MPGAYINSDEGEADAPLQEGDRRHVTVCHAPGKREGACDEDGDGIREVHNNTLEDIWAGLRNFLRRFRGAHEKYLDQYVAVLEWPHNVQTATIDFLRDLLEVLTPYAP